MPAVLEKSDGLGVCVVEVPRETGSDRRSTVLRDRPEREVRRVTADAGRLVAHVRSDPLPR